jgi:hypothetical protein
MRVQPTFASLRQCPNSQHRPDIGESGLMVLSCSDPTGAARRTLGPVFHFGTSVAFRLRQKQTCGPS